MADNVGKLQIVIKGGKPWGFHLKSHSENRSAVIVDHIESGGKADIHGGLKVGDHIIKINDVLCLSLADALQLIDSAFRTLTVLVWRPSFCNEDRANVCNNNIELQPKNSNSTSYPSYDRLNSSVFHKFHDFKYNMAIPRMSERYSFNSNKSRTNDTSDLTHTPCSPITKYPMNPVDVHQRKDLSYKSCLPKESLEKPKRENFSSPSNVNYLNPLPSTNSHQRANLQYICEQYPLSELFLSHKSDLKLESLASHSKRLLKATYHNKDIGLKTVNSIGSFKDIPSVSNETNSTKVSECLCCMYPKCHNSYTNCKMHSPPERDLAVSQNVFVDQQACNQQLKYEIKQEEKHNTDYKLSAEFQHKNPNYVSYKNVIIKEDGFKNSDLKVFKPLESFVDQPSLPNDYYDHKKQRKAEVYCQEPASYPEWYNEQKVTSNFYSYPTKEEPRYVNSINATASVQKFSKEIIPEISMKSTYVVNHVEQNKIIGFEPIQNSRMNEVFSLSNKHTSSSVVQKNSFKRSYVEEREHSMFVGSSNRSHLEISNEATVLNIFSAETSKYDGDEDEELCLIEENARNNSCRIASASPMTPDFALPPPPVNDDMEIIPSNDPLPSPPSFSPVKEVIYENVEVCKEPEETIYANLEMLKIKCSVVNSATQTNTPLQKPNESSGRESKQSTKSFSFVGTEIFSNIVAPAFGNSLRSDYMKQFLQSQLQEHQVFRKSSVQKSEGKYVFERHAVSLPLTSAYFTTSEPKAKLLTRYISNLNDKDIAIGGELNNKKEELVRSINKKLGVLRLEQIALKEEVKQNEELGNYLAKKLSKLAKPNETEKFRIHVEELEKITNLILSLSGRLARAENALLILPGDAPSEEKCILEAKYSKLSQQYEEANNLKKNIERRNFQVSVFLRKYFTEEEFADYDHFIKMKTKLLMDCRELDEKIKLGEEQLAALKSSVDIQKTNILKDDSSSSQE